MIIFKSADLLHNHLSTDKYNGKTIGFVPTMGALHKGHLSLIESCRSENDITVCSIFINPTQFNNPDDFAKYPVTIEPDLYLLEKAHCDIVFLPSTKEIYPDGFVYEQFDLGFLEQILEGKYRPGHFQGVCQVVKRLLQIVEPHALYLGRKDYQQCMIIEKLLQLMSSDTVLKTQPTYRETDGLAMSSRNMRLSKDQRSRAPYLYEVLQSLKSLNGNAAAAIAGKTADLEAHGFKVDYLEIADAENLRPVTEATKKQIILAAAFLGDIRLIDNIVIND